MIPIKIGEAFVELVTDGRKLTAGLNDAEKQVVASTNAMSAKFKAIGTVMTAVGGVITAAFTALIYKTVQAGDELWDMSQRTGIAVEKLSALGYAAKQSGTDMGTVETSLKFLARAMADTAAGTGTAKDTFDKLGIAVKDSEGKLRPTIDVMKDVATAISGMTNETEQTVVATELFGSRMGTQLLPMLKLGGNEIDNLMKKAKELGIVFSSEDAQAADEFKDKMNDLKEVLGAAARSLANVLIPTLMEYAKKAVEIIKKVREWADAHKPLVEMIVKTVAILGILGAVGGPIFLVVAEFYKMKAAILAVSLASKTELIPSITSLGTKLIGFTLSSGPIGIMTLAITGLALAWKLNLFGMQDDWDKTVKYIKDTSVDLLNGMKSMISGLKDTLGGGGSSVGAFFGEPIKKEAIPAVIELTSYTEELIKKIENLSTSFELSQKYISDNNKSMSDSIKYYSSMISLMNNLDSGLRIELEALILGTAEYDKKSKEIDDNTKALNEMKVALDAALAPLKGLDLIDAQMKLLGDTVEDNRAKLILLKKDIELLNQKLTETLPGTGLFYDLEDKIKDDEQAIKDLNKAITDTELSRLGAEFDYLNTKFAEGAGSVSQYKDQIFILEDELDLAKTKLAEATPKSEEWYKAKITVEEYEKKIKDLQITIDNLIIGKKKDIEGNEELKKSYDNLNTSLNATVQASGSIYDQLMANGSIFDQISGGGQGGKKYPAFQTAAFGESYAKGISYVPKTGLALIHQGEKIIPANQNTTNNSNSYSPSIVVNVSGNGNVSEIKRAVQEALNESKRQFLRRGSELALGI